MYLLTETTLMNTLGRARLTMSCIQHQLITQFSGHRWGNSKELGALLCQATPSKKPCDLDLRHLCVEMSEPTFTTT